MTRSQIEYILAVDQHKNFGQAAESCHITQSTLSAMVAKFEKQNGVILFNRKTKPISTTPQGAVLIKQLKNIRREMQSFDEIVNQIKGVETGHLSMACIPTVAPYIFPSILNNLERSYPKINFSIREITTSEIIEQILSGKLDVGIVSTPLKHPEIVENPLYDESFVLYDKRDQSDHPSSNKTSDSTININEIDYNRLLLLEEGHCFRNQVAKICKLRQKKTIKSNITYTSGTIESLKNVVTANKGLTLLPFLSSLELSPAEKNHIQYFKAPVPAREIGLIYHKNFIKTRLVSGLIDLIKKKVGSKVKTTGQYEIVAPF